ncbi:MAG: type 1 glutamine amidotransferase [Deltaproteobacteria bacterium]|nr:type 1 glutamine amidotransferase [Deltaproteobacteria bacterium]
MRIHWLQHVPFEGLGSIEAWASETGHLLRFTRLFAGEKLPGVADFDWLIVMGGPMNVDEEDRYPWLAAEKQLISRAIEEGRAVLGLCLGAQLIARALGARVYPNAQKEIGWFPIEMTEASRHDPLFREFPGRFEAFHWHGDTFDLPEGAVRIARSEACENQGFVYRDRVIGLQFHLETTPAGAGQLIDACGDDLRPGPFVQDAAAILADRQRFRTVNGLMRALLEGLPPGRPAGKRTSELQP